MKSRQAPKPTAFERVKTLVIGGAISPFDQSVFHKLSLIAIFAWVGLGADGLSSSTYGPQEAFLALGSHPYLAVFVALASAITIFVISASYSQIIELFPTGGGGYLVASKLLSPTAGVVSGCALLIDYVLTITLSIAAGSDAIFSFLPAEWAGYKIWVSVLGVILLVLLNLRGVKEAVFPLVPIFLTFIVTHVFVIVYAIYTHVTGAPHVISAAISDIGRAQGEIGLIGVLLVVLRAYSLGAGTFTGIEAVSNGIPILRDPKVKTAKRTMRYMAASLAFMVLGLMIAYLLYNVQLAPGKTLNAVLFETLAAGWSPDVATGFIFITLLSEAALLFVAAQTGFLDGPRVLSNMAVDRWMPTSFATLSNRLVTQNGVVVMGGAALALMLLSRGSVTFLVVLYSINVFITFTLSQLGMVKHVLSARSKVRKWKKKLVLNGLGLILTTFILIAVTALKFNEGGWITLVITGATVGAAFLFKRHYTYTYALLERLNGILPKVDSPHSAEVLGIAPQPSWSPRFDPNAKTAVLFVNGYNGLGIHTLRSLNKLFSGMYRNFVFVQIGEIDAGNFKGTTEIKNLQSHVRSEMQRYVNIMHRHGYYAEGITSSGTDAVDEAAKLAPLILERFPNAVFFAGQHIFPEEDVLNHWLHNNFVFSLQHRLYHSGIPFIILPIEVDRANG